MILLCFTQVVHFNSVGLHYWLQKPAVFQLEIPTYKYENYSNVRGWHLL